MGLTGQSATSSVGSVIVGREFVLNAPAAATTSVGSLTITSSQIHDIQGLQAISSVGSLSPEDVVGLTGLSATSSVGSISPAAMAIGLTGLQATSSVGSLSPAVENFVAITGVQATTSVGSIVPAIGVPLTGLQATSSVGAIAPTSMTVGLTGQSMTSTVGTGFILKYFWKTFS